MKKSTLPILALIICVILCSCSKSSSTYTCVCTTNGQTIDKEETGSKTEAQDDCSSEENIYQSTDPKASCTLK